MLDSLKEGLREAINRILGKSTIDEAAVKEFVRDLQRTLLQGDVNVSLVLSLTSKIEVRALKELPPPGLSRKDHIVEILYEELSGVLGEEGGLDLPISRLNRVLLVGIQGSGKTTVSAKIGRFLQKRGYRVGLVCTDTFRPGALVQLRMLAKNAGLEVFGSEEAKDPVDIASKGLEYFNEKGRNVVLVDTAGRHKEEKALIDEMRMISEKVHPDLVLLVIDGTMGQQCYAQAEAFHKAVPVGGIVVTKLDGAAKGGGALAAAAATGAKVLFLGTGERVDDLETFAPTRFVGRLLGLGDIRALLERAKELELEADEDVVKRLVGGKMTMNDFLYQIEQMKKMGSLRKVLEMIPGLSSLLPSQDMDLLEGKMEKWRYIIQSMGRGEKEKPELINSSRIRRIARGSGVEEKEVRDMMARFVQTKNVMKASKGRGFQQLMRRMSLG